MASSKQAEQSLDTAEQTPQPCFACRIIGTAALAVTGVYALNVSRAHQPGSVVGKKLMGAIGVGFLIGSVFRWTKS